MQKVISVTTAVSYRRVLKPLMFLIDPEVVHNHMVQLGEVLGKTAVARGFIRWGWAYQSPRLVKKKDGIVFPNPIGLSAGFDYNGRLTDILPAVGFGFHTIGTVTLLPYAGNPIPRLGRFPLSKSLLVNKGLKNDGARRIIHRLEKKSFAIPTGISIASTNRAYDSVRDQVADILDCFRLFEKSKVKLAYYELNISCPNTFGGEPFTTPKRLEVLIKAVTALKLRRPLYIKMPIDQTEHETGALLAVLAKYPVNGVIFGNLTKDKENPAVHPLEKKRWLKERGNLSGKPTWERSNALIRYTRRQYKKRFTIIGTGGVFTPQDAREKLACGADLVQLITGMIYEGPQVIGQMAAGLG